MTKISSPVQQGAAKVNMREIAKKAGVSVATVSRALNDGTVQRKVSPKVRDKILRICDNLQYRPNINTVRMLSGNARSIAFLTPPMGRNSDPANSKLALFLSGIEHELSATGNSMIYECATPQYLEKKGHLQGFRSKKTDGVIVLGTPAMAQAVKELKEDNVPTVLLNNNIYIPDVSSVKPSDYNGVRMVITHLLNLGHRHFAYIPSEANPSQGEVREQAILKILGEQGIKPVMVSRYPAGNVEGGYAAGSELLQYKDMFSCILCPNDLTAYGVLQSAKGFNVSVPNEISITGADGIQLLGQHKLTTYVTSHFDMGAAAARVLLTLIRDPESTPSYKELPIKFIAGETTGPAKQIKSNLEGRNQRESVNVEFPTL